MIIISQSSHNVVATSKQRNYNVRTFYQLKTTFKRRYVSVGMKQIAVLKAKINFLFKHIIYSFTVKKDMSNNIQCVCSETVSVLVAVSRLCLF